MVYDEFKKIDFNVLYIGTKRALFILEKLYEELIFNLSKTEGSEMTLEQTIETLSGIVPKNVKSKDVRLVMNLKDGFDYIIYLVENNKMFLDKNIFCNINRIVAANDNFDNLGDFRKNNIRILGSKNKGSNPENFSVDFVNIINEYFKNKNLKVISEINLFLNLIKAQFFRNGNKRSAQLLINGLLLKDGFAPFTINFKEENLIAKLLKFYDNEKYRIDLLITLLKKQIQNTKDFSNNKEIINIEKIELDLSNLEKKLNKNIDIEL